MPAAGFAAALCLLLVLLCAVPAHAADDDDRFQGKTWDEVVEVFLSERGIDPEKVALGYRNTVTGEEHFYPAADMLVNSGQRLCFVPGFAFGAGEWEAIVCTQFTPTYHLYKEPRYGTLTFTVI